MAVIARRGVKKPQAKPRNSTEVRNSTDERKRVRKPKGKTLSVILPQEVYAQLEAESIAEERSMGWIVREALAAYFAA